MNTRFRGQHRLQDKAGEPGSAGGGGVEAAVIENGAPQARALQQQGAEGERTRITEIEALAARYKLPAEMRADMIKRGVTIEQARLLAPRSTPT